MTRVVDIVLKQFRCHVCNKRFTDYVLVRPVIERANVTVTLRGKCRHCAQMTAQTIVQAGD